MINILSGIFSFLPSWIKYLPLIALISVSGYLYWQNKSLQENNIELSKSVAEEQRRNSLLSFQLEEQSQRAYRQAQRLEKLQGATRVAEEENNRLKGILDSYRGKEEIAVENTEDIERRANDALRSLLLEYECKTGNIRSCPE